MSDITLAYTAAALALVGLMAYAVLGGADFGGGVWDLFATGPRKRQQRDAIAAAMGPVWEANHVWLIFVVVVLFTCFPYGYAPLGIAMFIPFHLALVGIMLRGGAFVFRGYGRQKGGTVSAGSQPGAPDASTAWNTVFGVSSLITPFLLGCAFGAVTAGGIHLESGAVVVDSPLPWLRPYSIGCGFLALSTCAYLAAVYLTWEADGDLREDFRRRAIFAGTTTAALAFVVLALAFWQARWFFDQLFGVRALPVVVAGLGFFGLSAWGVFTRRYGWSRVFAAGEIVLLLLGWGLAQAPYLVYPSMKIPEVMGPPQTIRFLLVALPFGALLLVPSLWILFKVFKSETPPRPAHS